MSVICDAVLSACDTARPCIEVEMINGHSTVQMCRERRKQIAILQLEARAKLL